MSKILSYTHWTLADEKIIGATVLGLQNLNIWIYLIKSVLFNKNFTSKFIVTIVLASRSKYLDFFDK